MLTEKSLAESGSVAPTFCTKFGMDSLNSPIPMLFSRAPAVVVMVGKPAPAASVPSEISAVDR